MDEDELDTYIKEQAEIVDEGTIEETTTAVEEAGTEATPVESTVNGEQTPQSVEIAPVTTEETLTTQEEFTPPKLAEGVRPHPQGGFTNKDGDIVNHEGGVIAKGGFARRMYEQNQRSTQHIQSQDQLIGNLEHKLKEQNILTDTARTYGLTNDDTAQALDLAARVKRGDVKSVARDIVALLASQGHNVSEILGDDVGNSIDMQAVKLLLDNRLGPVHDARQQQQDTNDQQIAVQKEYHNFLNQNQFANVHEEAIVAVMKNQNCNPQQAYNQIAGFANHHRLNFSQPLGPQIEARQKQGVQTAPQTNAQNPTNRPMPSNGANTHNNGGVQQAQTVFSDPDDSWGEIISQVQQVGQ